MTAGSNPVNPPAIHPRDDREALSALFDGELPGDAVRFTLKRLDHDAGWRETCGRWQLIGDALRGRATTAAPPDFANGVMRALTEASATIVVGASEPVTTATSQPAMAGRRRWIGGAALAASVAVAAVLVVRPLTLSQDGAMGDAQVASAPMASAPLVAPAVVPAPAPPVVEQPSTTAERQTAMPVRVADARPRPADRSRRSGRSVAQQPPGASAPSALASTDETAVASIAAPAGTQRPFHPLATDEISSQEIATRPWPRPVLPETAAGALTVDFGSPATASPSFYPFEPRPPASDTTSDPQPR